MSTWLPAFLLLVMFAAVAMLYRRDVAAERRRSHEMQAKILTLVEDIYSYLAGPNPPPPRS